MEFQTVLARQLSVLSDQLTAAVTQDVEHASAAAISAERERAASLEQQLAALQARLAATEEEHAALAAQASRAADEARAREADATDARAALRRAEDEREKAGASRLALEAELAQVRGELASTRSRLEADLARARSELTSSRVDFESELVRARAALESVRAESDEELQTLREAMAEARAAHRDRLVDRLSAAFEEIGLAASVEDVLSAAATAVADDFARVAVFAVNAGRLEARYQRGFAPASGVERSSPALDDGSFLARGGETDQLMIHPARPGMVFPFDGAPSVAITAPIVVRGALFALLYADDEGQPQGPDVVSPRARIADIVRRHAALRLDRLTVDLKTVGELRAYARMLLDEVEYVYRSDVSAKKSDGERIDRLKENLRCARQIYQQRVTVEGPATASLLEEVITSAIATRAATAFGRDLAAVTALAFPEPQVA